MNERILILRIEQGLEYYLWSNVQVLIHHKLGDMEILLQYQFLAVLHNSFMFLDFGMDVHFSLVNNLFFISRVIVDLN